MLSSVSTDISIRRYVLLLLPLNTISGLLLFIFLSVSIHAVRIYSQEVGREFGIEKCAMLVMKSGKRHLTEGMELPNQD